MGRRKRQKEEVFQIKRGKLGPLGPNRIEVRPLTVFIGRQGTGKSLVAQLLYFFRDLPTLVQFDLARRRPDEPRATEPKWIVKRIIDGLRSSNRSFANLTKPNATVEWNGPLSLGRINSKQYDLGFNTQYATRQILPRGSIREVVKASSKSTSNPPGGVFIPTERLLYSLALGPTSLHVIGAPLILELFTSWMERAGRVQSDWIRRRPDTPEGEWVRKRMRLALAGEPRRRGSSWRWSFREGRSERQIDLDMASSGQRANWSLSLLPQVLFSLQSRGDLARPFTIFVEEPEIHLHPRAEQAVIEVLAYLVKNGFRVVVTTHSLTVLYALNNLLLASKLPSGAKRWAREIPAELRVSPDLVSAYLFADESVEQLIDRQNGLIREDALGGVADALAAQMNRIYASADQEA